MSAQADHQALAAFFRQDSGSHFLSSFPLATAHIQSSTVLEILRAWCKQTLPSFEQKWDCRLTLIAFGSLGRLEFVGASSDLDAMIVTTGTPCPPHRLRSVLSALSKAHPWLLVDDRDLVVAGRWKSIRSVDLKFPVLRSRQITHPATDLERTRRWQLILEARPLYGDRLFDTLRKGAIPCKEEQRPVTLGGRVSSPSLIDFEPIADEITDFYASFENPAFLYKSALKYWKTRFLREFYMFAVTVSLVLGWYRQNHGEYSGVRLPIGAHSCANDGGHAIRI